MVDEGELVSRVAREEGVIAVAVFLRRGTALSQDVDKATEERHRGSSDTRIAQEPPPGDVILDRINFMGF